MIRNIGIERRRCAISKYRIIWQRGQGGGSKVARRLAPHRRQGGTCEFEGYVHIYDELPGEVKVEGGIVFWQGQEFCPSDKVVAIFQDGKQIYP